MFEYFLEIKKWQIIQENITDITVNVLSDNISDELENKIFQGMGKRLPDSIKIKVNWNPDLEKKGEGKIPVFISKV